MNNFLIGMYGRYDEAKCDKDFRPDFFGVEACMFPDEQEVERLVQKARKDNFRFGVHYPLIKKDTPYRDPFLISMDTIERESAFECLENEAIFASEKGAAYILTHFPKPVLVNRSLDLLYWRFAGERDWMFADEYPPELLIENLDSMFDRLNGMSKKHNIQVLLENDAMSTFFTDDILIVNLLERYDKVRICLDIGRLHLQEKLDLSFNALEFTEKMAPYTYLIHLWNTNPAQNLSGGHYPVLPGQKPSEGWADVRKFTEIIKRYNNNVKVLFEHRSDLVSNEKLDECYHWVGELFEG